MQKTRKQLRTAANSPALADIGDNDYERFMNLQLLFYRLMRNNSRLHNKGNIFLEILSRSVKMPAKSRKQPTKVIGNNENANTAVDPKENMPLTITSAG